MASWNTPCDLESNPPACFDNRRKSLEAQKYPWEHIRCENCKAGIQNAISQHKPEAGVGPRCIECGEETSGRGFTGLCLHCSRRSQYNIGNRKPRKGVKAYWGYRAKAHRIKQYEIAEYKRYLEGAA